MKILIVDDEEIRHEILEIRDRQHEHEFFHAYRFAEAKKLVTEMIFDLIRLDYDLRDPEGTGMSVVQLLIGLPAEKRPKNVICHSLNCYRRATMAKLLENNGISALAREFE